MRFQAIRSLAFCLTSSILILSGCGSTTRQNNFDYSSSQQNNTQVTTVTGRNSAFTLGFKTCLGDRNYDCILNYLKSGHIGNNYEQIEACIKNNPAFSEALLESTVLNNEQQLYRNTYYIVMKNETDNISRQKLAKYDTIANRDWTLLVNLMRCHRNGIRNCSERFPMPPEFRAIAYEYFNIRN